MAKNGRRGPPPRPPQRQVVPIATQVANAAKAKFAPFLEAHPDSSIDSIKTPEDGYIALVRKPWSEAAIGLLVAEDSADLEDALNNIILPKRLSAIWHRDHKALEVIWTAQVVGETWKSILDRDFIFAFDKTAHRCHFSRSSDRLLAIAKSYMVQGASNTNHRNLQSFWSFMTFPKDHHQIFGLSEIPHSFWIEDVNWDEVHTVRMLEHLNFYMTYYDRESPLVLVHTPLESKVAQRTRYLHGNFPKTIAARDIDSSLLSFWSAGYTGNPMMAFLLYYRILEFAAFNYIDFETRANIKKILAAPDVGDANTDQLISRVMDQVAMKDMQEIPRLKRVIRQNVSHAMLWRDISANKDAFANETVFDGGFVLKPLIAKGETQQTFCDRPLDSFSDTIRQLRNTIAHGKQQEAAGVVEATDMNIRLIRPWMHLVATAAGEVILYKDVS